MLDIGHADGQPGGLPPRIGRIGSLRPQGFDRRPHEARHVDAVEVVLVRFVEEIVVANVEMEEAVAPVGEDVRVTVARRSNSRYGADSFLSETCFHVVS